uniref:Uncharacterized protein n=1 Tax=Klebsiella pneumoniae TaxID=573 RepID=A0A8B0SP12_KLEPN|nr:hypothetical protein [Klebsiella pneumoniae]
MIWVEPGSNVILKKLKKLKKTLRFHSNSLHYREKKKPNVLTVFTR